MGMPVRSGAPCSLVVVGVPMAKTSQPQEPSQQVSKNRRTWVDAIDRERSMGFTIGAEVAGFTHPSGSADRAAQTDQLWVVSGILDYVIKPCATGTPDHRQAQYALDRQDTWSSLEHRDYWEAHLPTFTRAHRSSLRHGDAAALAWAIGRGLDPEAVLDQAGFGRNDGRRRDLLDRAQLVAAAHTTLGRSAVLPRVVTTEEEAEALDLRGGLLNVRLGVLGFANPSQQRMRQMQIAVAIVSARQRADALCSECGGTLVVRQTLDPVDLIFAACSACAWNEHGGVNLGSSRTV
jgi:hypothetical protein